MTMIKNEDPSPCILDPLAKINDQEDPKPKRQQSNYIFQRDLRHPISRYTSVEKIVIKKELYPAIKAYLESRKMTKEFIYGKN